ncbi:hypothetical protein FRC07_001111 [Ceratobasidium sp. 392]|nr:hypothetical protein FRC07_001111 [Ceratobasidium sp. 392]
MNFFRFTIRNWSAEQHLVAGVNDCPSNNCTFGKYGWTTDHIILQGIADTKRDVALLQRDQQNILAPEIEPALYMGRPSRPLPYSHSFNYTSPLPTSSESSLPPLVLFRNKHIESALNSFNYDPSCGGSRWKGELQVWTTCPQLELQGDREQTVLGIERSSFDDPLGVPVCPHHWAVLNHLMVYNFIWSSDLEGVKDPKDVTYSIFLEVDTPEYAGRIQDEKIAEKRLALGGM